MRPKKTIYRIFCELHAKKRPGTRSQSHFPEVRVEMDVARLRACGQKLVFPDNSGNAGFFVGPAAHVPNGCKSRIRPAAEGCSLGGRKFQHKKKLHFLIGIQPKPKEIVQTPWEMRWEETEPSPRMYLSNELSKLLVSIFRRRVL